MTCPDCKKEHESDCIMCDLCNECHNKQDKYSIKKFERLYDDANKMQRLRKEGKET